MPKFTQEQLDWFNKIAEIKFPKTKYSSARLDLAELASQWIYMSFIKDPKPQNPERIEWGYQNGQITAPNKGEDFFSCLIKPKAIIYCYGYNAKNLALAES